MATTLEEQVQALTLAVAAVNTTVLAIQTQVNALAPGSVTTPAPVDFTVVTDAITASQTAIIAEVQKAEAQLTEVINDIEQ
jgi:hypothetical protein